MFQMISIKFKTGLGRIRECKKNKKRNMELTNMMTRFLVGATVELTFTLLSRIAMR